MENARIVEALKANRRDRVAGYGLVLIGAVFALFFSNESPVTQSTYLDFTRLLFVGVFIASAATCFIGSVFDVWLFEYVGLLPLLSSFGIYGLSILVFGLTTSAWVVIPSGASLLGFALLFRARRTDLRLIYHFELRRKDGDDEGSV